MNERLARELIGMRADDLRVRSDLERAGRLFRGYDAEMEAVHRRNAARLRDIIGEHGWPGRDIVGDDGADAAWLIAQHAIGEPDFQRSCLVHLQHAAERGAVPRRHVEYLLDRIRVFEGWPQLYGTQVLDARRDPAADAWARRVGWRPRILHLSPTSAWTAARRAGVYTADSLAAEGFIHCSEPQQAMWVANTRFRGRDDLVLLQIAVGRLKAPLRYENLQGGEELFPHIYGPLELDAVIHANPFPCRADGSFHDDQLSALY